MLSARRGRLSSLFSFLLVSAPVIHPSLRSPSWDLSSLPFVISIAPNRTLAWGCLANSSDSSPRHLFRYPDLIDFRGAPPNLHSSHLQPSYWRKEVLCMIS
ncbi:hypothetical protein BGW80DRAFT_53332 [Lactifluus volemus]|nr:hypothetical protein BGW80DRAFT_53332 [Lactifluus volemus]